MTTVKENAYVNGDVSVVATGTAWVGSGVGSVNTAIENMLRKATTEVQIAVYDMTGGADEFLVMVRGLLARGIPVTLVVNRFDKKGTRLKDGLNGLAARYRHFGLYDFAPRDEMEDLHAKVVVRDRAEALIGSANLTWRGMVLNHELAVIVSGTAASTVARLIDDLARDPRVRRVT